MRRPLLLAAVLLALTPAAAGALPLPEGAYSGVELVASIPEAQQAIAISFIKYEDGRDIMFVSTYIGLFPYDISDPLKPVALGKIASADMAQPGDAGTEFFENEDMEVDQRRKLVFMTRDLTSHTGANPGVYIIDAKDPAKLSIIKFQTLPEGHTSSCIQQCDFLWTAGLLARREIFATDLTDPAFPKPWPLPIDVGPFDQPAGTSHDVTVDSQGVAWVSGQGYIRGYWTSGTHKDPILGIDRAATPTDPVLYGGGKVPTADGGGPSDLGRFMHNAERPAGADLGKGAPGGGGFGDGNLLYAAEENIVDCGSGAGEFVISSLKGALDTDATGDLETVGSWGPKGKDGEGAGACSAHWFTMRDGIVAEGFYAQGTRFIDVRDPKTPVQVAFFRPDDGVAWAAYFHGPYVYVADNARGVDILRLKAGAPPEPLTSAVAVPTVSGCAGPTTARAQIAAKGLRLTRRSALLRGSAADLACGRPGRVARVQVALARAQGGRCAFLSARGKLGRAGSCEAPLWLKASGTSTWRAPLRGKLAKGSYFAFARAVGSDGRAGDAERGRLVVGKGGRARLTREVTAPSRN